MAVEILVGDVFERLYLVPDKSIHCVVTSPPYWGLRDYGHQRQIGLEPNFRDHIDLIVSVFREIRRVLRPDGTCWLNYGDAYSGSKDLLMMPNRIAIALQENDGWFVRSEIIWHKSNPMPESVRDRPTSAHEKIWLLSKSDETTIWRHDIDKTWRTTPPAPDYCWINKDTKERTAVDPGDDQQWSRRNLWRGFDYYYDADAVRVPARKTGTPGHLQSGKNSRENIRRTPNAQKPAKDRQRGHAKRHAGFSDRWDGMTKAEQQKNGANLRNVWTVATKPFPDAHFATFPPELIEPCIKAGCPEGGTVLDPFGGAGTTGLVADRLGRNAILIEINPEYAAMARRRIDADAGLFSDIKQQETS